MIEIDLKALQQSADVDPKVMEVYRLLKSRIENEDRRWWEENVYKRGWKAVYESEIWDEKTKTEMEERGQIPLPLNNLAKGVQGSTAIITDQKPGFVVKPIGSADLYVSELFQRGLSYVWDQNEGSDVIFRFCQEAKTASMGRIDVSFDNARGVFGKIVFKDRHPDTVYWDTKADNWWEGHLIKAHLVTKSYAKDQYPNLADEDLEFKAVQKDDGSGPTVDTKTGKDNYAIHDERKPSVPDLEEEQEDVWEIEALLKKRQREFWLMVPKAENPSDFDKQVFTDKKKAEEKEAELQAQKIEAVLWERTVEKRIQRIVVGKKLISEEENPYGIDADGEPILPTVLLPHDRTLRGVPVSPTFRATPIQMERNKRRALAIYTVTKQADSPIVMTDGAKWVQDKKHGDYIQIEKNAGMAPTRLPVGATSAELIALEQEAKKDIDEEYDAQDVVKGKMPAGDPSGRTILALQDMAGMMSKPFTRGLESAVVRVAKVIASLMLKHWPRTMWERLIDPDEMDSWQPKEKQKIDPNTGKPVEPEPGVIKQKWEAALERIRPADPTKPPGIELIDLDVKVLSGSTMPTNRMAKQANAADMVKAGIYPPEIALEYLDDPMKDRAIELLRQREQQAMQADAMKGMK